MPAVAALIGVTAIVGASAFAVWSIESDLERRTRDELRAQGVDDSAVRVDFSYRDGTIEGELPADLDVSEMEDTRGVRAIEVSVRPDAVADQEPEQEPERVPDSAPPSEVSVVDTNAPVVPMETTPPPPQTAALESEFGQVDVIAEVSDDRIALSGSVHTEDQRVALVEAAATRVGAENVDDQLTLTQTGSAGPLPGLVSLLAEMPVGVAGNITLAGDELGFTGTAMSADASEALGQLLDATERSTALELDIVTDLGDQPVETSSTTTPADTSSTTTPAETPSPLDGDVEALQAELDALAPNIAENVVFASSSDDLEAAAADALDDVVSLLDEYPGLSLIVTGHTDSRGDDETNLKLSASRAEAVVLYLTRQGVDRNRLQFVGAGEAQPIADNATADGQRQNRRVVFTAVVAL